MAGTTGNSTGRGHTPPGAHRGATPPGRVLAFGGLVGEFVLQRKLGEGGMGEVWLAHQPAMDRLVAVKVLREELTSDPARIADFLTEVRVSAKLDHPNIVTAITAGVADREHYLVTAYIEGVNVGHRIDDAGRLPESEALRITRQTAVALDYAWSRFRMMHRDIKPTNLMVTPEGDVRVLDMGIARMLAEGETLAAGAFLAGTPNYMSPEVATGEGPIDCRADIYALGATLYHMLGGRMPYAGLEPQDVVNRLAVEPPPPIRTLRPDLSAACLRLLDGMMAREVDRRYADWAEVLADLQRIRRRAPPLGPGAVRPAVRVVRQGPGAARPRARRRSAAGTLLSGAALLLLAGGGGYAAYRWFPRDLLAPPPPSPLRAVEEEPGEARSPHEARLEYWNGLWAAAVAYAEAWPDDIAGVVQRFEAVREQAPGTRFAEQAEIRLAALAEARHAAAAAAWTALERAALEHAERGQHTEALRLLQQYDGPFARDIAASIGALAETLQRDARRAAAPEPADPETAQARLERAVLRVDAALAYGLTELAHDALVDVRDTAGDPAMREWAEVWAGEALALKDMQGTIEALYRDRIGDDVELTLRGETMRLRLMGVRDGRIEALQLNGDRPVRVSFHPAGLPMADRLALLQPHWPADRLALAAALHAAREGALDDAARHFEEAGLSTDELREALRRRANEPDEARAAETAADMLRALGLPPNAIDRLAANPLEGVARPAPAQLAGARRLLGQLQGVWSATVYVEARHAALLALQQALDRALDEAINTPGRHGGDL